LDTALFYSQYSHLSGARVTAMDSNAWQQAIAQAQACLNNPANYVSATVSRCYLILPGYNSHEDRARSWGGEVSSQWHVRPWWKMQTAYSYLRVVGTYTGDPLSDNLLKVTENSSPRHQLLLINHWRVAPDWSLNMALRRQSGTLFFPLSRLTTQAEPISIPAYTDLDLRLAWQYSRRLELSIMGRNLLQERHTEFINSLPYTQALDVRRSIYMQAVLRF
jgi:iron complex outermembrane receptor protein